MDFYPIGSIASPAGAQVLAVEAATHDEEISQSVATTRTAWQLG
jgi:hypothetical protein